MQREQNLVEFLIQFFAARVHNKLWIRILRYCWLISWNIVVLFLIFFIFWFLQLFLRITANIRMLK